MDRFERFVKSFSYWLFWIGGAGLVAMLGLTVADIIGTKLFRWPVPGAIEVAAFLGVVVTAFAIAYTQVLRGHIQVEFVVLRLPRHARASITALTSLLGLILFALLAWRSYDFAHTLQVTREVSMTWKIPFYPLVYGIAFSSVGVCLVLLAEFLRALLGVVKR